MWSGRRRRARYHYQCSQMIPPMPYELHLLPQSIAYQRQLRGITCVSPNGV